MAAIADDMIAAPDALAVAERAARTAGAFLAAGPRRGAVRVGEAQRDVKLQADRQAEDLIVEVLRDAAPIPVLAEERSGDAATDVGRDLYWVVDPLDGTMNYLQGIPFCCVSVALWERDAPIAGVVYDFDRDEMFAGRTGAGGGAWLNGAAMQVEAVPPERAVLCTGFPAGTDFAAPALSRFVQQVIAFRKIRLLGSAALSLAYVAAGRAHAYFERDIRLWDVAAGLALVRAAGGEFIHAPSPRPHALTVYAHNGSCPWPEATFG